MRFVVLTGLLGAFCSGCSTTLGLSSVPDANRKVGGGSAIVTMRSGVSLPCRQAKFGEDSTHFICASNDSLVQVSSRDIKSVRVTNRLGGCLEGLILGGMGGLGVGLVVGAIKGHDYTYIFPVDSAQPRSPVGGPSKPDP